MFELQKINGILYKVEKEKDSEKIKLFMSRKFLQDLSRGGARMSLFLLFSLLSLSVAFYVMANDAVTTDKNIFQDSDQDGLSNDEETLYKTDPLSRDTDGDGYMDGVEVEGGYDPTKPAPGDKLVSEAKDRDSTTASSEDQPTTLTDQATQEIASIVQDSTTGEMKDVSIEDINASVQDIMSQSDQEIILPEIDLDEIKVKSISTKLKGKERIAQEKDDSIEYLTVMSYVLANNFPKKFHTQNDFISLLTSFGSESLSAVTLGNDQYLEDLSKSGKKILEEIKDIEVPESMLDIHAKAIKMAKYSMQLKDEVKGDTEEDPLGKISSLSKVQGFLGVVADLTLEIYGRMGDLGITEIPINL